MTMKTLSSYRWPGTCPHVFQPEYPTRYPRRVTILNHTYLPRLCMICQTIQLCARQPLDRPSSLPEPRSWKLTVFIGGMRHYYDYLHTQPLPSILTIPIRKVGIPPKDADPRLHWEGHLGDLIHTEDHECEQLVGTIYRSRKDSR